MLISLLLIGAGFSALLVGGTAVVSGSVVLAYRMGVSTAIIGLTVVAFGTSAPEMAVSVLASLQGSPGIAVGNVFGSNIFNVLVAIGTAALIAPVLLSRSMMRREVPLCVLANLLVIVFAITDAKINVWEGFDLVAILLIFLFWSVRNASSPTEPSAPPDPERTSLRAMIICVASACLVAQLGNQWDWAVVTLVVASVLVWFLEPDPTNEIPTSSSTLWIYLIAGIGMLITGAELLVRGSTEIGYSLGISDAIIGLTVVAIGTSAPELATSIIAAKRGELELAMGNALGSNLFNLLGVLGLAALISGVPVAPRFVWVDGWLALASVLVLPILGHRAGVLERKHGMLLVGTWVLYTLSLVVMALL